AWGQDLDQIADWARHGDTGPRENGRIGFSVVRGGDIIGDHTVYFCGTGERIEITHRSSTRATYAQGSLRAARYLARKDFGLFDMHDVLANYALRHGWAQASSEAAVPISTGSCSRCTPKRVATSARITSANTWMSRAVAPPWFTM